MASLAGPLAACGARGSVAARVGERRLTADRLAGVIGRWGGPHPDTSLARRVANWWVEYQLFARQIASGDSLLDSATVREVLWPAARAYLLARWRQQLFAGQLPLDSASLDSVYQAGDYRLIQHVLLQAPDQGPAEARARARRRAEALRSRLARGLSWAAAQQENQDASARRQNGSVGVITRGQTEPDFERAVFALEPGEISDVIATSLGYHIARRPPLREVRDEFGATVEPLLAERLDSLHVRELAERWHLRLQPGGDQLARAAVRDPLRYQKSRTVFARFERGRFTLADLVRWLQAVPDWMHIQAERDPERYLARFLETMMGYELLYREALDHGVKLSPAEYTELKGELAKQIAQVTSALDVHPPAPGESAGEEERLRQAGDKVDQYLDALPGHWERFARVPPGLAERLKERAKWVVYSQGIERSVQLAAHMRAAREL